VVSSDSAPVGARQGRALPIGGLVGTISFEGELAPFLPWLQWAGLLGVGKDATKGNEVIDVVLERNGNGAVVPEKHGE
jgi:CRISPR-associated endoribonuclease Cas6